MFKNSSVVGRCHIFSILLPAIDNFFKNGNFLSSGTSYLRRLPLKSKSVKFLNFEISEIKSTPLFTNLNEIKSDGFLTSDNDLIAVVLELKLLELQERFPFLVRIVLGYTFYSSWVFEG